MLLPKKEGMERGAHHFLRDGKRLEVSRRSRTGFLKYIGVKAGRYPYAKKKTSDSCIDDTLLHRPLRKTTKNSC